MLDWKGRTAVIVASGPSLTVGQCRAVRNSGHPSIAVNASFRLAWPAVVYMGDMLAVKQYVDEVRRHPSKPQFWTQDANAAQRYCLHLVRGENREGLGVKRAVHLNGNSGFQALNLAFLFGARRILLVGFDMKPGPKGEKHWHPDHPRPLVQGQCFEEWIHKSAKLARDLEREQCEVVNCTPGSALTCWPIGDLEKELVK